MARIKVIVIILVLICAGCAIVRHTALMKKIDPLNNLKEMAYTLVRIFIFYLQ